ncbi:uncharacterized protein LOC143565579 [Bidens hawaiensis]|uniref:uncharacterized protein LOC143565579 n=1 Tax=Bidens hawaiensis TaxID=980011 RepID=UPI00404AE2A0
MGINRLQVELPHIKNWFSSYEYESFVLETNDNFGFSEHQESQDNNNECSTGNTTNSTENLKVFVTNEKNESLLIKRNQSEEDNKCQKHVLESQDSPLLTPEPAGIENWFSSYVYESPEVDTVDDLILSDLKESTVDCHENMEFVKDENLCVTPTDDLVCKQTFECDNSSTKKHKKFTDLPNEDVNVSSLENGSKKVEEDENGFVSMKSKKEKYEKSKRSDERVTLGDVTNVLDENSSVTGKWKCPRKRKPDMGPPLKQLRL